MRELLEQFFRHYLRERNLEDTLALLTDQVISLGTGEQEVARNKEELRALMECEFKEMPQPLDYELFNYTENPLGEYGWSIFTNVLAKIDSEGVTMEMLTRLTCICVKEDGKWKIASLHMSTPTVEQEHQEFFLSVMAGITVSGSFLLKPRKADGTGVRSPSRRYYGQLSGRRISSLYH